MINYSKKIMEPYALDVLTNTCDEKYAKYFKPEENDFDYISINQDAVLEITMALPQQSQDLLEYDKAIQKNGVADEGKVNNPIYLNGKFLGVEGTISDVVNSIEYAVLRKEQKRKKREKKLISQYELCILSPQAFILDISDFKSIQKLILNNKCGFNRLFIITSEYLYIIEKNNIKKIKKSFKNTYKLD